MGDSSECAYVAPVGPLPPWAVLASGVVPLAESHPLPVRASTKLLWMVGTPLSHRGSAAGGSSSSGSAAPVFEAHGTINSFVSCWVARLQDSAGSLG